MFPLKSAPQLGSVSVTVQAKYVVSSNYFPGLLFVSSTFPFFCISVKLQSCLRKPSNPFLVGQMVRQQNLRCPFLVISGGNACYHNPLPHSFLLSPACCTLSMNKAPLQSAPWCKGFIPCFSFHLSICTLFATRPLYVFYYTLAFCFDWPFQSLLLQPPHLFLYGLHCGITVVWHSVLVIGLSGMMCKEKASAHQKHTGLWVCGTSLEPQWSGNWG